MLLVTVQKTKETDIDFAELIARLASDLSNSEEKISSWGDIMLEEFEYDENDSHRLRVLTGELYNNKQPLEFQKANIIILDFPPEMTSLAGQLGGALKSQEKLSNFYIIIRSISGKVLRIGNKENWCTRN